MSLGCAIRLTGRTGCDVHAYAGGAAGTQYSTCILSPFRQDACASRVSAQRSIGTCHMLTWRTVACCLCLLPSRSATVLYQALLGGSECSVGSGCGDHLLHSLLRPKIHGKHSIVLGNTAIFVDRYPQTPSAHMEGQVKYLILYFTVQHRQSLLCAHMLSGPEPGGGSSYTHSPSRWLIGCLTVLERE